MLIMYKLKEHCCALGVCSTNARAVANALMAGICNTNMWMGRAMEWITMLRGRETHNNANAHHTTQRACKKGGEPFGTYALLLLHPAARAHRGRLRDLKGNTKKGCQNQAAAAAGPTRPAQGTTLPKTEDALRSPRACLQGLP